MKWQPIETAPRDGTPILVLKKGQHPITGEPYIPTVQRWWSGEECWGSVDIPPYQEEEAFNIEMGNWFPTHWMPLPNPPEKDMTDKEILDWLERENVTWVDKSTDLTIRSRWAVQNGATTFSAPTLREAVEKAARENGDD